MESARRAIRRPERIQSPRPGAIQPADGVPLLPVARRRQRALLHPQDRRARRRGDSARAPVPFRVYDVARRDVEGCGGEIFCVTIYFS